jgi:hypothetical protein
MSFLGPQDEADGKKIKETSYRLDDLSEGVRGRMEQISEQIGILFELFLEDGVTLGRFRTLFLKTACASHWDTPSPLLLSRIVEVFGTCMSPKSARQLYRNALKGLTLISSRFYGVPRGERGIRLGNFCGKCCELTVAHSQSFTAFGP